jgi:hypothetical protein
MPVEPDQWHHLLLSYDVAGASGRMWLVLDDVTRDGKSFYPASPYCMSLFGFSGAPNDILASFNYPFFDGTGQIANSSGFKMITAPIGIPAQRSLSEGYREYGPVELAELQIFTGLALDITSANYRRAFLDYDRDAGGNPIGTELKPVAPSKAEKLIGKKPEILLHGTDNWKAGRNTGTLGFDGDGNPNPDGQFVPIGTIDTYKPDPTLSFTKQT